MTLNFLNQSLFISFDKKFIFFCYDVIRFWDVKKYFKIFFKKIHFLMEKYVNKIFFIEVIRVIEIRKPNFWDDFFFLFTFFWQQIFQIKIFFWFELMCYKKKIYFFVFNISSNTTKKKEILYNIYLRILIDLLHIVEMTLFLCSFVKLNL